MSFEFIKLHLSKLAAFAAIFALAALGCTPNSSNSGSTNTKGNATQAEQAQVAIRNSPVRSGRLVVFGDSLAAGTGASSSDFHLSTCIGRKLSWTDSITFGVPGLTSQQALNLVPELLAMNPSAVLISLGGNDVLRAMNGQPFPPEQTFSNLTEIYRNLQAQGVFVAHMGLNPPIPEAARLPAVARIANQLGVLFMASSMAGLWGNPNLMADELHPNDQGYAVVCERLAQAMRPHFN